MHDFIIPLSKIDEAQRLVYGRAVQEVVDRTNEIIDYATAKPAFEKWSKGFEEATGGLSRGNLRVMHDPKKVAGKVIDLTFNDADKAIDVVAKVVDDQEWKKVLEGVFTGFSVGGGYGRKWKDEETGATRYTPVVTELSLVDNPCIPTARITLAKNIDFIRTDGTVEELRLTGRARTFEEVLAARPRSYDEVLAGGDPTSAPSGPRTFEEVMLAKRTPGSPLSDAEYEQRKKAAEARWNTGMAAGAAIGAAAGALRPYRHRDAGVQDAVKEIRRLRSNATFAATIGRQQQHTNRAFEAAQDEMMSFMNARTGGDGRRLTREDGRAAMELHDRIRDGYLKGPKSPLEGPTKAAVQEIRRDLKSAIGALRQEARRSAIKGNAKVRALRAGLTALGGAAIGGVGAAATLPRMTPEFEARFRREYGLDKAAPAGPLAKGLGRAITKPARRAWRAVGGFGERVGAIAGMATAPRDADLATLFARGARGGQVGRGLAQSATIGAGLGVAGYAGVAGANRLIERRARQLSEAEQRQREEAARASAEKRRAKTASVMREFKDGRLHSSSGQLVTNRKQAVAIALSEARRAERADSLGKNYWGVIGAMANPLDTVDDWSKRKAARTRQRKASLGTGRMRRPRTPRTPALAPTME
jgi:hypothetical protein